MFDLFNIVILYSSETLILNDAIHHYESVRTRVIRANKNLLNSCMAAAEAAANAALLNNKTVKLSSDEIISNNNKIINQSTPKSAPENQLHAFNFDANQIIENKTVSSLTSSSSPLFKMTDNVFTDSSDDKLTSTNEHKFKNQLKRHHCYSG